MKKPPLPPPPQFIVIDSHNRVFAGLREGYPFFSEDWNEAKPLKNNEQVECIKRGYYLPLTTMDL